MDRIRKQSLTGAVVIVLFALISCERNVMGPFVGKTTVENITINGALVKGQMISDEGANIREYGFCWSRDIFPTIDDSHIGAEKDSSFFFAQLSGLNEGTRYYVRLYAAARKEIFYGEVKGFITIASKPPSVFSPWVKYVSHNSVTLSEGRVTEDNTYDIFSRGICWSTSKNPTLNDNVIDLGSGFGGIGYIFTDLQPSTVYYFRAYATNAAGTTYAGNKVIRTFDGSVTDNDGNVYSTVRLGSQEWMSSNLRTRSYSNGDWIGSTGTQTTSIELEVKPSYQWAYLGQEDHPELLVDYGRLYTWHAVNDSRKLCPAGWHIPSINEWNELLAHLGGTSLTSVTFRRNFNIEWDSWLNPPGNNESSFWAILAGFRNPSGTFQSGHNYGTYWWSSSEESALNAETVYCSWYDNDPVLTRPKDKKMGLSVRCVKD